MNRFFFLLLIIVHSTGFAQNDSINHSFPYKTYPDKLTTKVFTINTSNDFNLYFEEEDLHVELVPNKKTILGIGAHYDILAFSIGYSPRFLAENKDNEGSSLFSFSTDLFLGPWIQHLEFIHQDGMTVRPRGLGAYYQDNLSSMKVGGSTSFKFNPHFSYNAMRFQNQRQLVSAGSFIPTLSYYYTSLDGIDNIIYSDDAGFLNIALTPSYYYNFVFKEHFLVSGGIGVGLGYTKTFDGEENHSSLLTRSFLSLAAGYNTDRFFAGFLTSGTVQKHQSAVEVDVSDTVKMISFFIGYRFNAPKQVVKVNDDVKDFFARL